MFFFSKPMCAETSAMVWLVVVGDPSLRAAQCGPRETSNCWLKYNALKEFGHA